MKRVTVNTNSVGLVYKRKELKRVLTAGSYWLGFFENIEVYDQSKTFYALTELDVLLLNKTFKDLVNLVEVKDNELVLVYQNGNFKQVLTAGKYAFWIGLNNYSFVTADLNEYEIAENIDRNTLEKPQLSAYIKVFKVESYETGLMIVDGRLKKTLEPGNYIFWKNSTVIQVLKTDIRQLNMEIAGQEILTKDKAQLRINFSVQYKVTDAIVALLENKEFDKQLYMVIQLALREFIGKMTFDELMENKEKISENVLEISANKASGLGVALMNCGVKDIILPGDIKEIMNQVLIAEKRAQANLITRREETASTRSLLNTAKLMEDNTMLYKLKEMEYVEKIAEKIHTISLSGGGQIVDQLKQIFIKS
ncbi:slipin family protein [Pedobacter cryoconitis]|uniref:Regulator of protease activity HflC (Stomatin/prohibitin superfamily) n=1 Tax=Pedobacter cryoconitis TaxID=188932 RepID=A0A7X0J7H8_9SPHI|nr:slipin family protein [Pedobacter cryoconitis]MBB6501727.1 regulator of protease activity HflC (stomatin/prohibitin superfamily) [Pedobacter cryoconitis]